MTARTLPTIKNVKLDPKPGVEGGTLMQVPVGDLQVLKGLNVRVELTNLDELQASIEANGFYADKPLAGYMTTDDKIVIVDGHRRLAAVTAINGLDEPVIPTLPVIVKPESASLSDLTIAMVQSAEGVTLTMFEKGLAVRRLLNQGMTKEDIATRLGNTVKTLDNWITVASAPAKARDLLLDGKVTSTQVLRAMVKPEKAAETLSAMVEKATSAGRERARPSDASPAIAAGVAALGYPVDTPVVSIDPLNLAVGTPDSSADDALAFSVDIVRDGDMGAMLRQMATEIRARVPHDQGEADGAMASGRIVVSIALDVAVIDAPAPRRRARKPAAVAVVDAAVHPTVEEAGVPIELAHAIPADDEL